MAHSVRTGRLRIKQSGQVWGESGQEGMESAHVSRSAMLANDDENQINPKCFAELRR